MKAQDISHLFMFYVLAAGTLSSVVEGRSRPRRALKTPYWDGSAAFELAEDNNDSASARTERGGTSRSGAGAATSYRGATGKGGRTYGVVAGTMGMTSGSKVLAVVAPAGTCSSTTTRE